MMNNKKIIIALVAFVAVVAIMLGIYLATRPTPDPVDPTKSQGETNNHSGNDDQTKETFAKTITVEVVHSDGTKKTFTYGTNADYLGEVLYAEGLILADESNPGMFHTVDGEKADWNENRSYWSLYEGEEYAMQGVETTPVNDGDYFRLVYTIG